MQQCMQKMPQQVAAYNVGCMSGEAACAFEAHRHDVTCHNVILTIIMMMDQCSVNHAIVYTNGSPQFMATRVG
jgi:hypothetical protein